MVDLKRPRNIVFLVLCILGTGTALHASVWGWGVQRPDKQPPSIREGSSRQPLGSGHHRTRFFIVGGGIHRGK